MIIIKIGFIGAGKVGFTLGKYLKDNNINVVGYFSKSEESSLEASNFTKTKQYKEISILVKESDAIIITTPDDKILEVWNKIKKLSIKNKFICHCSGSLSSDIFSKIGDYGAYAYSIHPMFPISDKYNSYNSISSAFITIEGDKRYIYNVKSFIERLGNKTKIIEKGDKAIYHLASVISSNLMIGLISIAINYLNKCGFTTGEAIGSLYPLIKHNVENINSNGIIDSLTGPVERGDINTINSHYFALDDNDKAIYKTLSNVILKIAKEKNKGRDYTELEKFLGGKDEEYSNNI